MRGIKPLVICAACNASLVYGASEVAHTCERDGVRTLCGPAIVEPRHVDQVEPVQRILAPAVAEVRSSDAMPVGTQLTDIPRQRPWTVPDDAWMLGSPRVLMDSVSSSSQP
jgi:hypothetical protein